METALLRHWKDQECRIFERAAAIRYNPNYIGNLGKIGMIYEFVHPRKHITEVPFYHLLPSDTQDLHKTHLDEFFWFMYERQEIWYKRNVLNEPRPWTDDKFLDQYQFTNVYRELDRSSQYLIKNVLTDDTITLENMIFKIMVYRYFNKPDCFEDELVHLPNYETFNPAQTWAEVINCRANNYNPWHTAYMSNLVWAKDLKPELGMIKDWAYCRVLFPKFQESVPKILEMLKNGIEPVKLMKWLEKLPSISGFMSHELFLDFCYLNKYSGFRVNFDENSYTNVGPGASLGIKLILPSLMPSEQSQGIYLLRDVSEHCLRELGDFKYVEWCQQDMQYYITDKHNITLHQIEMTLCEFSKYKKMQWGLGKQRSKFQPKPNTT